MWSTQAKQTHTHTRSSLEILLAFHQNSKSISEEGLCGQPLSSSLGEMPPFCPLGGFSGHRCPRVAGRWLVSSFIQDILQLQFGVKSLLGQSVQAALGEMLVSCSLHFKLRGGSGESGRCEDRFQQAIQIHRISKGKAAHQLLR